MNILISNDDGINVKGIHLLEQELEKLGDVNIYVYAPDSQRSCSGHRLDLFKELYVKDCINDFGPKTIAARSCSGSPADCVRLGLYELSQNGIDIDLCVTGINHGPNLGSDMYYSGTMAAAREAVLCNVPAIAFSLCSHETKHWESMVGTVSALTREYMTRIPAHSFININVPDIAPEKIKGKAECKPGLKRYTNSYTKLYDGYGCRRYIFNSVPLPPLKEDKDRDTVLAKQGFITVTTLPLCF